MEPGSCSCGSFNLSAFEGGNQRVSDGAKVGVICDPDAWHNICIEFWRPVCSRVF